MKVGDLVKTDDWVAAGQLGVIVEIQKVDYCRGAFVLLRNGVQLIRVENLKVIHESR